MMKDRTDSAEVDQPLQVLRPNRLERRSQASKLKRVNKPTCSCCTAAKGHSPPIVTAD